MVLATLLDIAIWNIFQAILQVFRKCLDFKAMI